MLISVAAMYAFSQTPLGRIANALRDNPERLRFIGYNPHAVRFRVQLVSSFFAGVAGALSAINYEIVTIDGMGVAASGTIMLMTVIGGAGFFLGPVLGAVLVTFMETAVSSYTHAWLFYFGLLFLVVIYSAPEGLTSVIAAHRPIWRAGRLSRLLPSYGCALVSGTIVFFGVVVMVESLYRLSDSTTGSRLAFFGVSLSPISATTWVLASVAIGVGGFLLSLSYASAQSTWKRLIEPAG